MSGSRDGTIQVWDPSDGRLIRTWRGHFGRIEGVALSPDGSRLATTGPESGVLLWDTESGIRVRSLEDPSSFSTVAISPDGHLIAAAGIDRVIRLWDVSTGRPVGVLHGHTDRVNKVAFSPDGRRLASASSDGSARFWDVEFGRELLALPGVSMPVSGITFSPDGIRIAATDSHIKIWEVSP